MAIERDAAFDTHSELIAQRYEIADRAEMNVRGLVPGIGEALGDRHQAGEQKTEADPPKAEVGERDNCASPDADELLDDFPWPVCRLQGLAQHDDIERPRRVGLEVAVGVTLNDRQNVADAEIDARSDQLDAAAVHALVTSQKGEQLTIAAADVEDTRLRIN